MPEAPLDDVGFGLAPAGDGWFVVNARDAVWLQLDARGSRCDFESEEYAFRNSASHSVSWSRVRGQRATGALDVVDGFEPCRVRASVILERRTTQGWSIVRRARTNGAGLFAVPAPGRATYRARAPQTTANGERCVKALSRAVTTSG